MLLERSVEVRSQFGVANVSLLRLHLRAKEPSPIETELDARWFRKAEPSPIETELDARWFR